MKMLFPPFYTLTYGSTPECDLVQLTRNSTSCGCIQPWFLACLIFQPGLHPHFTLFMPYRRRIPAFSYFKVNKGRPDVTSDFVSIFYSAKTWIKKAALCSLNRGALKINVASLKLTMKDTRVIFYFLNLCLFGKLSFTGVSSSQQRVERNNIKTNAKMFAHAFLPSTLRFLERLNIDMRRCLFSKLCL